MEYRVQSGVTTSTAIIQAVADVTDRDPMDLAPIAENVDPDAVNDMFTRSSTEDTITLQLLYEGCRVEVDGETVVVEEIPEA